MKLIIAIDPGASGGIAWYDGQPHVEPMPETSIDVRDLFVRILSSSGVVAVEAHVEKVGGYIGGDDSAKGSAMFGFGFGAGFMHGCLAMAEVPVIETTPQRWQKELGMGTRQHQRLEPGVTYRPEQRRAILAADARLKTEWKTKLKGEAQRRYPGLKVTKKTADALLILSAAMKKGTES
jgi:hypothetical protein